MDTTGTDYATHADLLAAVDAWLTRHEPPAPTSPRAARARRRPPARPATAPRDDPGAAWTRLSDALRALSDDGYPTPCQTDPTAWYADDPDDRDLAARACQRCPVRLPCSDYADAAREREGVWGALDRTRGRGQPTTDRTAQPTTRTA